MKLTLARGEGYGNLERETGFEPATSTLARSHSTTELLPHSLDTSATGQPLWDNNFRAAYLPTVFILAVGFARCPALEGHRLASRSEEHTSALQSPYVI